MPQSLSSSLPSLSLRPLARRDVLEFEQRLCAALGRVIGFSGHAIYFPQDNLPADPQWLPDEASLLVPLWKTTAEGRELLGVFAARQVQGVDDALLARLPNLVELCLENLELYKNGRLDPVTGLVIRPVLIERMAHEIAAIQNAFAGGDDTPAGGSLGIVAVRLAPLRDVAQEHGQAFADRVAQALADAFCAALPEGSLAARSADYGFAAFLPAGTRQACERAAVAITAALDTVQLGAPLTRRAVGVLTRVGFALYPQDMDGVLTGREPEEQAQRLVQRAALAASVAARSTVGAPVRHMGYGRILSEGGMVMRTLPLARLVVSLGRTVGAREGQRFAVWARPLPQSGADGRGFEAQPPLYKGELALVEVRPHEAEAEVVYLGEPTSLPGVGDTLTLLPDSGDAVPSATSDHPRDPGTGLLRHGDFLAQLATAQSGYARHALALVHVEPGEDDPETCLQLAAEAARAQLVQLAHAVPVAKAQPEPNPELPADPDEAAELSESLSVAAHGTDKSVERAVEPETVLGGRYGRHTLIFFHPDVEPEELAGWYAQLSAALSAQLDCRVGVGLACWPFLRFRAADMPECARKALEYALLLPAPHVGVFDSLALNISADKRHCLGDVFGAVEEYKLALLADPGNALAWNSLGVCMAGLARNTEARHYFEEALLRTPDDAALAYNLGAVCLSLGDVEAAEQHFHACLRTEPAHLYAMVRLGQAAEQRKDMDAARAWYLQAIGLEDAGGLPYRHLARLCLRAGQAGQAREHLHQALQRNPRDPVALQLMAGLYLDGGEDPNLAESLARHSVALRPDRKAGWLVLARALECQNRHPEARQARMQAGEL